MKKFKKIIFSLAIVFIGLLTISQVAKRKVSPAKMNTEKNTKFVVSKEKMQIKEIEPLRADNFEVQLLSEKSDIGKANDILLTIKGEGFSLTSTSPVVVFNKNLRFKNTEVNEKGTELYVIISKEEVEKKLSKADFKDAKVTGRKLVSKDSGKFLISAKDFTSIDRSNIVSLKYRNGFFVREE